MANDKPLYRQLGDDLRTQILNGHLVPGAQLPTEPVLAQTWGVSRIVVRQALAVLVSEGLIVKHHGKGTFVREEGTRRLHIQGARHPAIDSPATGWIADVTECEFASRTVPTPAVITERLGIRGTVLCTRYRFFVADEPAALVTSYEPSELAIAAPSPRDHADDVVARMELAGVRLTHVVENVTARTPRRHELADITVPAGVPVLVVERTFYAGDQPVHTSDIVASADRYTLGYAVGLRS